jgi:hypothetical protein
MEADRDVAGHQVEDFYHLSRFWSRTSSLRPVRLWCSRRSPHGVETVGAGDEPSVEVPGDRLRLP